MNKRARSLQRETLAARFHFCFYQADQFISMPPNPSLNADVPHARLRPRSGPLGRSTCMGRKPKVGEQGAAQSAA